MNFVIHATNIHLGGGHTLLLALLAALDKPAVVLLDERLTRLPALDPQVRVIRVAPRIIARLRAERQLQSICDTDDTLLCFGNLPPLFENRARVFVYLQNRYLIASHPIANLPWRTQLRIRTERKWLHHCRRDATFLVQTESMAQQVRAQFGWECSVLPFMPSQSVATEPAGLQHDFVYVASGEAHKNHRRLVAAWEILSARGLHPSLCLTLDPQRDAELLQWINQRASMHGLHICNQYVAPEQVTNLYLQSRALLYPSLFESFGLPLLEARATGLQIIAAERDYVRDVVTPAATFDPESPLSIARAVMRHLTADIAPPLPLDAYTFLQQLEQIG